MSSTLDRFLSPGTAQTPARIARIARTDRLHGFTLAELETEAHPDEWAQIRDNPAAVQTFALMLREEAQIAVGVCPERWTGTATCRRCGPVPVAPCWDGWALDGCRWCSGLARTSRMSPHSSQSLPR